MYSVVLLMAVTSGGEVAEFGGRRGCRAACGGCYSWCGGCSAWCGGCRGRRARGCHGCYSWSGCHGGCYAYAGHGCYGGCYAYAAPVIYHHGCAGGHVVPGGTDKKVEGKDENTARITVTVPEGAIVKIDGENTVSTSAIRTYQTPTLERGKTYSYTFVAEYQEGGKPMKVEKKVSFQAGSELQLDLRQRGTAVASK